MKECQITREQVARDDQKLQNEANDYHRFNTMISKFDSFGGWVATAIDLTKLLVNLIGSK